MPNIEKVKNFIFYTSDSGNTNIQVVLEDETIWATQNSMAEIFGTSKQNISSHLKNIFENGELDEKATVKKILTVQKEGQRNVKRGVEYYNLDAIISVGYRVNSVQATQFRKWATKTLKEYLIKGFVLDDDRLKQGNKLFGKDYFRELLDRVRSIRASERRIYQQVTDIFAECCIDYNSASDIAKNFYANIQNKFHYAITGKTAAEIIFEKADKKSPNMGLMTWKNYPGRILKSDTDIAKNYLSEKEIKKLERTITSYFDYIENQIEMENAFTMEQLSNSVVKFLSFNDFKILKNFGKVSTKKAKEKAHSEYDEFNKTQKIESDFDKFVKKQREDSIQLATNNSRDMPTH